MKILHPTDFSPSADVARGEAERLARILGAELLLLHVIEEIVPPGDLPIADLQAIYDAQQAWAEGELAAAVATATRAGVKARATTAFGFPVDRIVATAEAEKPDLIVIGTRGRGGVARLLLGSVAERVVRSASCPVMTLREAGHGGKADTRLILVPTDFSPGSDAATRYGIRLAGRLGARVRLLHAITGFGHTSAGIAPGMMDDLRAAERAMRVEAEKTLAAAAARLREEAGNVTVETATREAGPSVAGAIVAAARDAKADMIVMGTHGRSGIRRMVLGSVAEQVVRTADGPVVTVR